MAKMKATEAAVRVLEAEGVTTAFGVPGAAINPFYGSNARARSHPPHPRPPRRGRLAHGRRLHPGGAGQHRGLHWHVRSARP